MATYEDDLAFSEAVEGQGVIRLIKMGKFMRAYDHSAWLFVNCIADYKVLRKYLKRLNREVFYIGFPAENLSSTINKRRAVSTDRGFDVSLSPEEIPAEEGYELWRSTVKAEEASKADYLSLPLSGVDAEREVIRRLREFPVESKTMMDCMAFVVELRKLLFNK